MGENFVLFFDCLYAAFNAITKYFDITLPRAVPNHFEWKYFTWTTFVSDFDEFPVAWTRVAPKGFRGR